MKHVIFIAIIIAFAVKLNAQVTQQKPVWAVISVPQMKCWECKERLTKFLIKETGPNDEAAILQFTINLFNATVRIQYIPDRTTLDYIRTEIANAGYDADSIKATEDSYKVLPPACKRKDEGGGPQKGKPCNVPTDQRR